jgi:hypothetical protein
VSFANYYASMVFIRFKFPAYTLSTGAVPLSSVTTTCVNCANNVGLYDTGTDSSGNAYIDFLSPKSNKLTYTFAASYITNPSSPISSTPSCLIYTGTVASPTLITTITANTITY